jgi:hypothetical protein
MNKESTRPDSEQNRIEFLDGELDLCQTFLDVADIEADDPERQALARTNAQRAYETALAWIGFVRNGDESDRLNAKLGRLKERLERPFA